MYPDRELARLAAHKAALRRRIGLQRAECAEAATQLAKPLAWLDRMVALWRRVSPVASLAAVPLGLLATRASFPLLKKVGTLVRWGPILLEVLRLGGAALKPRRSS